MDDGQNVQDENLVNDQVAQAVSADATPTAQPLVDPGTVTPADPAATAVDEAAAAAAGETPEATPAPLTDEATPEVVADEEDEPVLPEKPETPQIVKSPSSTTAASVSASAAPVDDTDDEDLMDVKQKALEQLSPIIDHIDLPPEQKFDTYMEILRASDDKSLVEPAFAEAQKIEDEDKRAQALLDVVNEVNYLTQDHAASDAAGPELH